MSQCLTPSDDVVEAYLPGGTVVQVNGVPVRLLSVTPVRTTRSNFVLIEEHDRLHNKVTSPYQGRD